MVLFEGRTSVIIQRKQPGSEGKNLQLKKRKKERRQIRVSPFIPSRRYASVQRKTSATKIYERETTKLKLTPHIEKEGNGTSSGGGKPEGGKGSSKGRGKEEKEWQLHFLKSSLDQNKRGKGLTWVEQEDFLMTTKSARISNLQPYGGVRES